MDPMIPYFTSGQITVEELLDGVKPSDLPLAFDALLVAARAMKLSNIEQTVLEIKGWEKEQRERQARQVVEEVRPVTEVSHQAGPRSSAESREAPHQARRRQTGHIRCSPPFHHQSSSFTLAALFLRLAHQPPTRA